MACCEDSELNVMLAEVLGLPTCVSARSTGLHSSFARLSLGVYFRFGGSIELGGQIPQALMD